jgi:hypothetical protein
LLAEQKRAKHELSIAKEDAVHKSKLGSMELREQQDRVESLEIEFEHGVSVYIYIYVCIYIYV